MKLHFPSGHHMGTAALPLAATAWREAPAPPTEADSTPPQRLPTHSGPRSPFPRTLSSPAASFGAESGEAHPTAAPWGPGGPGWGETPLHPPRAALLHLRGASAATSPRSQHGCGAASVRRPARRGRVIEHTGSVLLERTESAPAPCCGRPPWRTALLGGPRVPLCPV